MQEIDKNFENYKNNLFSGNAELIVETIKLIKETPHYELVEVLFDLYLTTQNTIVKANLFSLFIDIKDKKFVIKLVDSLIKPKFKTVNKELISICWQCGLDFSEHLQLFVDKMVSGDDELAIECFTVIENSIEELTKDNKEVLTIELRKKIIQVDGVKSGLIEELLYLLE